METIQPQNLSSNRDYPATGQWRFWRRNKLLGDRGTNSETFGEDRSAVNFQRNMFDGVFQPQSAILSKYGQNCRWRTSNSTQYRWKTSNGTCSIYSGATAGNSNSRRKMLCSAVVTEVPTGLAIVKHRALLGWKLRRNSANNESRRNSANDSESRRKTLWSAIVGGLPTGLAIVGRVPAGLAAVTTVLQYVPAV